MADPLLLAAYILIFPGFLFLFAYSMVFEFLDRRIVARMQNRVGPPFFQPFADIVKTLGKEVIDPEGVDRPIFDAAPIVALAAVMTAFLYVPVIGASPLAFQGDLVLVLYLLTLPTLALMLLGWLSRNIYAAVGGIRAVTMLFIYEVPFFLALMMPTLMAGTWSISDIMAWQEEHLCLAILQPIAFIVALIGLQAKLERTPFDIPEAETEIVAGPWTELTGRRLALMHLANETSAVVGSALIAAVFLGGLAFPWTVESAILSATVGFLLFLAKTVAILLVLSIIRAATARVRLDQLNTIGWKYLTMAALAQVGIVLVMMASGVGI